MSKRTATLAGVLAFTAATASAEPQPLKLQTNHENGLVLQVTSIEAKPTEVALGVRIINSNPRNSVRLHNNNLRSYLITSGTKLYLSPPADNAQLAVGNGQTTEGSLVFLGALPEGAEELKLVLNEDGQSSRSTPNPRLELTIPLSAQAKTTDDSKKN